MCTLDLSSTWLGGVRGGGEGKGVAVVGGKCKKLHNVLSRLQQYQRYYTWPGVSCTFDIACLSISLHNFYLQLSCAMHNFGNNVESKLYTVGLIQMKWFVLLAYRKSVVCNSCEQKSYQSKSTQRKLDTSSGHPLGQSPLWKILL